MLTITKKELIDRIAKSIQARICVFFAALPKTVGIRRSGIWSGYRARRQSNRVFRVRIGGNGMSDGENSALGAQEWHRHGANGIIWLG